MIDRSLLPSLLGRDAEPPTAVVRAAAIAHGRAREAFEAPLAAIDRRVATAVQPIASSIDDSCRIALAAAETRLHLTAGLRSSCPAERARSSRALGAYVVAAGAWNQGDVDGSLRHFAASRRVLQGLPDGETAERPAPRAAANDDARRLLRRFGETYGRSAPTMPRFAADAREAAMRFRAEAQPRVEAERRAMHRHLGGVARAFAADLLAGPVPELPESARATIRSALLHDALPLSSS